MWTNRLSAVATCAAARRARTAGATELSAWLLRRLFSVPKKMTTVAKLEWLKRRYGGAIVIDVMAVNGRGPELERAIKTNMKRVA